MATHTGDAGAEDTGEKNALLEEAPMEPQIESSAEAPPASEAQASIVQEKHDNQSNLSGEPRSQSILSVPPPTSAAASSGAAGKRKVGGRRKMVPWQPVGIGLNVPKRVRKVTGAMADYLSEKKKRRTSSASSASVAVTQDKDSKRSENVSDDVPASPGKNASPAQPRETSSGSAAAQKNEGAASPKGKKGKKIKIKVKRRSSLSGQPSSKKRVLINGSKLTMHEVLTTTVLNSLAIGLGRGTS